MHTYLDCIPCLLRQSLEAVRGVTEDPRLHQQVLREVLRMAAELDLDRPPPYVAQVVGRRLKELTGAADPYLATKRQSNRLALEALPDLRAAVRQAPDPLLAAATYAVAGNAIDMGVKQSYTASEMRAALQGASREPLLGDWGQFRALAAAASSILYLTDNAGAIVLDRLLIEELGPSRVTVAVRAAPVLNDATIADAHEAGLQGLADIIDNGSDAPGTILADCSEPFRRRFDQADLIIAKGQGNFETLNGEPGSLAFLFKVKCPVVASRVGLPLGAYALVQHIDGNPGHGGPQEGRP